jgi:hypothetical protein
MNAYEAIPVRGRHQSAIRQKGERIRPAKRRQNRRYLFSDRQVANRRTGITPVARRRLSRENARAQNRHSDCKSFYTFQESTSKTFVLKFLTGTEDVSLEAYLTSVYKSVRGKAVANAALRCEWRTRSTEHSVQDSEGWNPSGCSDAGVQLSQKGS